MRTILTIIRKEFIQVFRDKAMLPLIFIIPIVQLIVLVNAATLEMKSIKLYVVDNDMSPISRQLVAKLEGSPFYKLKSFSFSVKEAEKEMKEGKVDIILNIPKGFERKLYRENKSDVQLLVNAINGMVAGISYAYTAAIVSDFNSETTAKLAGSGKQASLLKNIQVIPQYWYNPQLNSKNFMVPAVLGILVTLIGMFLSGMNLVKEKEIGTIEQINVTPIKKYQFIAGKLIPFWIIAMIELFIGLIIGKILFSIPMVGNLGLLFFSASIYLFVVLGFGLFISTFADTQQQAMFISWFLLIVFLMMSGVFTSAENMPAWAQWLNKINPIAYFMRIVRMILLKGSGFRDILTDLAALGIYAVVILNLAIWRYKKVS